MTMLRLRLTLEEALRALAEKRGTTLAYHVGDGTLDDPSGWVEAETGTLLGDYGSWEEAASSGLGVTVVKRDPAAELVEALTEARFYVAAAMGGREAPPPPRVLALIDAALAKWKERP